MSGTEWNQIEDSVWQYGWVTNPPLVPVDSQNLLLAVAQMRKAVGDYAFDTKGTEDWEQRIEDTNVILKMLKGSDYNLIYKVLDTPVGIICLSKFSESVYIKFVVSHPGTNSAGGILIEAAADYSQKCGRNGKLELFSYSGASTAAYRALGFVKTNGNYDSSGEMTLDPANSDLWVRMDRWRLKKHAEKKHHGTRKKPVPPPPNKNY